MADPIIADECIHLMTTAFCTICKEQTRSKESRARRARAGNHPTWETEQSLPYPTTTAGYESACPHCDEKINIDATIHKVDGAWVCYPCALDAAILEGVISSG
jgi:hypothetical protein